MPVVWGSTSYQRGAFRHWCPVWNVSCDLVDRAYASFKSPALYPRLAAIQAARTSTPLGMEPPLHATNRMCRWGRLIRGEADETRKRSTGTRKKGLRISQRERAVRSKRVISLLNDSEWRGRSKKSAKKRRVITERMPSTLIVNERKKMSKKNRKAKENENREYKIGARRRFTAVEARRTSKT